MSRIARAELLMGQNRHDLAITELHGVLGESPDDPGAHVMMAMCLCETDEDYDQALEHTAAAIRNAPDWAVAHYGHAITLHRADRPGDAERAVREAIRLDPEDPEHFALLGDILLARKRWQEALAAADEGLALQPDHVTCTNVRAIALTRLGRKDEAGQAIAGALARDPENSYSHANMGWTALHGGDAPRALTHFREALRIDPNNEWAQAGMLEALKARYLVYRWILAYHFLMARLSSGGQWAILIGAYILYRVVGAIGEQYPQWRPVVVPLTVAYLSFAFLTWFSGPIFNALLCLNRFGRMVLPPRERRAAWTWVGMFAAGALGIAAWFGGAPDLLLLAGVFVLLMTLPVNATMSLAKPGPRRSLALYTAALAVLGLVIVIGAGVFGRGEVLQLLPVFLIAWIGFQWFANAVVIRAQ